MLNSVTKKVAEDDIQLKLNKTATRKNLITKVLPFTGLIFLILLFSLTTDGKFLDDSNFSVLVNQCFTLVIISVGAAFVYASGSMDMSIGGVLAFSQLGAAMIIRDTDLPIGVAAIACVLMAALCSSFSAIVHVMFRVPIFVASLCNMYIWTGIVTLIVEKNDVYIAYSESSYLNAIGVKIPVMILVILLGYVLFNNTRLGKDLKALGSNQTAAVLSGVRRGLVLWLSFVMLGICIGIAAFFTLLRNGLVNAASGTGVQINVMVAIVLGGFPLAGGARARLPAAIVGALMVTILTNGLILMGLNPEWGNFAKGVLFLIVVALTYDKNKGKLVL